MTSLAAGTIRLLRTASGFCRLASSTAAQRSARMRSISAAARDNAAWSSPAAAYSRWART